MELPLRVTSIQRALALLLLVPVLWAAKLEHGSRVARAVRRNEPWACWLALRAPANALPQVFLAYYRPWAPTLELVYVAENLRLEDGKTLPQLAAAERKRGVAGDALSDALIDAAEAAVLPQAPAGLRRALEGAPRRLDAFSPDDQDPPVAAKRWLRGTLRPPFRSFERLRLALEVRRLDDDQLRAVYLPEDPADREAFWLRLERDAAAEPASGRPVTVEILNATAKPGIANSAKKILRSRGADVMSTGNAPARGTTLVVDRVGRPELAAKVRRMLGCPAAEAESQMDAKRLVDVSVVLADDCALRE